MNAGRRRTLMRAAICAVAGSVLSVAQLAPQRNAWWGLMDDHEPLEWRAPGTSLAFGDIPRVIATRTEAGQFGRSPRYRPVYYTLRVIESWAWGASPAAWYRARIVMFAGVIAGAMFAIWLFAGPWLAAGATAFLATGWYWRDVWAHLGPAEQYASVGTMLVALGAALVWRTRAAVAGLWLAAMGTLIAVGCKENFIVLLVPLAFAAWHARAAHKTAAVAALAMAGAGAGLVMAAVVLGLRHAAGDIYGTALTPAARLWWVHGKPAVALAALWAAFALGAVATGRRELVRGMAVLLTIVTALVVSQATYYAPAWPRFGSRYDFPGRLADVLLFVGACIWLLRWLEQTGRVRAARWAEPALGLLMAVLAARHLELPLRAAAAVNTASTIALHDALNAVRDSVAAQPGTAVVIDSRGEVDMEPSGAVAALLSEVGVRGPYYTSLAAIPSSSKRAAVLTMHGYQVPTLRIESR